MRLVDRIMELGNSFLIEGKPLPVIETDSKTANSMADQIERELGLPMRRPGAPGEVIMFYGVVIRAMA